MPNASDIDLFRPDLEGIREPILAATCDGVRVRSVYVPNGRTPDDPHYTYKLAWLDALRATMSFPGLFTPARVKGRWLVDGGLAMNIPVAVGRKGAKRQVGHHDIRFVV